MSAWVDPLYTPLGPAALVLFKQGSYTCTFFFCFWVWGCIEGTEQECHLSTSRPCVSQRVCWHEPWMYRYPVSWQGSLSLLGCHNKFMPAHIAFYMGFEDPTPVLIRRTNGAISQPTQPLLLRHPISSVPEASTANHRNSASKMT